MEDVERRIGAIGANRDHGATYLTQEAVRTLGRAATACPPGPGWSECMADVAERLTAAKPTMASVANATRRLLRELVTLGPDGARARASEEAERLVGELEAAVQAAAGNAAALVATGATLVTCSYSSAVLRAVELARDAGKAPRVAVLDLDSGPDTAGRRLTSRLNRDGTTARTVGRDALASLLDRAALALVGADAVTPDFIVNGSPTLALTEAAKGRTPFYVVCESVKLTGDIGTEPGYDRVPFELVRGVITEEGTLRQSDVRRVEMGEMERGALSELPVWPSRGDRRRLEQRWLEELEGRGLEAALLEPPSGAPEALAKAVDQFNKGLFWECHETLEEVWLRTPYPLRFFYHAVIKAAVGFHHVSRHNRRGAVVKLSDAVRLLRLFQPEGQGVRTDLLLADTNSWLGRLEGVERVDWGELDAQAMPLIRLGR